ncbi:MAG: hypothetical protein H8D87_04825 [Deltaproteobacteria bacterium]|nr:hypothetical protein [Candidatus Desulfobacula maris]
MKLPKIPWKADYVPFRGGLDLVTPRMQKPLGSLDLSLNYVPDTEGGYSLIDGYERYSGQPSPSDGVYSYVPFSFTDTVSVGDTVTGVDSGATGVVVIVGADYIDITKIVGVFQEEVVNIGGSPVGSITGDLVESGETTIYLDAVALGAVADEYRADILKPAGSGPVRGLKLLKGTLYCFVDNPGGTAGMIFKESAAGWVEVPLFHEISFDTGVGEIFDGDTITQLVSGATALVKRVVHETGTWAGGTAAGRLIITTIVGTFNATNDFQVGAVTKATSGSLATAITITPGGRYEIIQHNFYASLDRLRLYGCDGLNRGFEFDGTTYVPINTNMVTDTPEYVYAHKKQLFFSFKASSQNSGIGEPFKFTALTGSTEIGLGDDITGYARLPGDVLCINSRNSSNQLIGNSISDFILDDISDEIGGLPRTIRRIGHVFCLDDRGIIKIEPTDRYGNFAINTISRRIQKSIAAMVKVVTASITYKAKNQYRLYGSNGTGICMTIMDKGVAFTEFFYPDNVACTESGEDANGREILFFGSDEGMVYQLERGTSFDGEEIDFLLFLPFNHSKSPTYIKSYKTASIELDASGYTAFRYQPIYSYGNSNIPDHEEVDIVAQGQGGLWDVSNWEEFFWDAETSSDTSIPIVGNGTNIGLRIYGQSAIDAGHKLDGITIQYVIRRAVR